MQGWETLPFQGICWTAKSESSKREAGRALGPRGEERKARKSRQRCLDRSTDETWKGGPLGSSGAKSPSRGGLSLSLLLLDPSCLSVLFCAGFWAADIYGTTYVWGVRARLLICSHHQDPQAVSPAQLKIWAMSGPVARLCSPCRGSSKPPHALGFQALPHTSNKHVNLKSLLTSICLASQISNN